MHIFFGTNGPDDYIRPLGVDFKYEQTNPTPFLPHISSTEILMMQRNSSLPDNQRTMEPAQYKRPNAK